MAKIKQILIVDDDKLSRRIMEEAEEQLFVAAKIITNIKKVGILLAPYYPTSLPLNIFSELNL